MNKERLLSLFKNLKLFSLLILICLTASNLLAQASYTVGTPISPLDRGAEHIDIVYDRNYRDLKKHLDDYEGSCGNFNVVSATGCVRADGIEYKGAAVCSYMPFPKYLPYVEYYIPFQKVETSETPYHTNYLTKEEVKKFLSMSDEALYAAPLALGNTSMQHLNQTGAQFDIAGGELNDDSGVIDLMKAEFGALEHRWRNPIPSKGGYRYMEMHVIPTEFHEEMLRFGGDFFKQENTYVTEVPAPHKPGGVQVIGRIDLIYSQWVHFGVPTIGRYPRIEDLGSWMPIKNPVPYWFSEFPTAVFYTRFHGPIYAELGDEMAKSGEPDNCITTKLESHLDERSGRKVAPKGIYSTHLNALKNISEKHCLPWMYGAKFSSPMNVFKDTFYATQAATHGDYRGIRLALKLQSKGIWNRYLGRGEFHELQEETGVDSLGRPHPANILQFLDQRRRMLVDGCKKRDFYLPDIWGPEYKEANKNYGEGERFVSADWRYIRGCPFCYIPAVGMPPVILE